MTRALTRICADVAQMKKRFRRLYVESKCLTEISLQLTCSGLGVCGLYESVDIEADGPPE